MNRKIYQFMRKSNPLNVEVFNLKLKHYLDEDVSKDENLAPIAKQIFESDIATIINDVCYDASEFYDDEDDYDGFYNHYHNSPVSWDDIFDDPANGLDKMFPNTLEFLKTYGFFGEK